MELHQNWEPPQLQSRHQKTAAKCPLIFRSFRGDTMILDHWDNLAAYFSIYIQGSNYPQRLLLLVLNGWFLNWKCCGWLGAPSWLYTSELFFKEQLYISLTVDARNPQHHRRKKHINHQSQLLQLVVCPSVHLHQEPVFPVRLWHFDCFDPPATHGQQANTKTESVV